MREGRCCLPTFAGGALIDLSAMLLLVLNGHIAGISATVGGLLRAIDSSPPSL
jgi:hypothetical protein